ncbi:hypothetical protein ACFL0J_01870 [Candidatus Neomarinimicrobiota bacterium]
MKVLKAALLTPFIGIEHDNVFFLYNNKEPRRIPGRSSKTINNY